VQFDGNAIFFFQINEFLKLIKKV